MPGDNNRRILRTNVKVQYRASWRTGVPEPAVLLVLLGPPESVGSEVGDGPIHELRQILSNVLV